MSPLADNHGETCPKCGKQMARELKNARNADMMIQKKFCIDPMCGVKFFEFVYDAAPIPKMGPMEDTRSGMQCTLCEKTFKKLILTQDSIYLCHDCHTIMSENKAAIKHLEDIMEGN